jgi:hypothetical protein
MPGSSLGRPLFSNTSTAWQLGFASVVELAWAILIIVDGKPSSGILWVFWTVPIPILTLGWVRLYYRVVEDSRRQR